MDVEAIVSAIGPVMTLVGPYLVVAIALTVALKLGPVLLRLFDGSADRRARAAGRSAHEDEWLASYGHKRR